MFLIFLYCNVLQFTTNEIMTTTTNSQSTTYWSATALEVMAPLQPINAGGACAGAGAGGASSEEEDDQSPSKWIYPYGSCSICKIGLEDRADFTINYDNGSKHGIMMCHRCDSNSVSENKKTCTNCQKKVSVSECIIGSKNPVSGEIMITFCRNC